MIKFDHSMLDQNQGREPMPHHAPFSIQDIQSAVEQGREAERLRIIALLSNYADAECPDLCDAICECFAKHEARMFISLIEEENK